MRSLSKCISIVGANGKYGTALGEYWKTDDVNRIDCNNVKDGQRLNEVLREIRSSLGKIYVIAIDVQSHTSEIGLQIYNEVLQKGGVAVCINSVQKKENLELEKLANQHESGGILCVHPNYGINNLNDNVPGTNLVTGVYGEKADFINRFLETVTPKDSRGFSWVDLRNYSVQENEEEITGGALHDYALLYTQALVHMVRLVAQKNDFNEIFPEIRASMKLSQGIIEGNPRAQAIYNEYFSNCNKDWESIKRAVSKIVQEAKDKFGHLDCFEDLKTPNYKKLENLVF